MCGIAGGLHICRDKLKNALYAIAHRGPDALNFRQNPTGEVSLGHVRLAIIDLDESANQPMDCTRTGNILTFNGEIYNFRAVRQELKKLGWDFHTKSDTEVLLAAYGEWGINCLARLNGMFAFALYDNKRKQIVLARDRIGKKPLYYSLYKQQLIFASEIKALLAMRPEIPRDIDEQALNEYLGLGYIPGEMTIFSQVRKLKPAHYAVFEIASKRFTSFRYWNLPIPRNEPLKENEAAEELESLLLDAVKIRMESDVPIGVCLSGGLDSSLIAAMIARENPALTAFTVHFPVTKYDESFIASQLANWTGSAHSILSVDGKEWEMLDDLAFQFDEPFADSSLLPTFALSNAMRQHVTVAISGDGGDELFAGYDYYLQTLKDSQIERVPRILRRLLSPIHKLMPLGTTGKNWLRRLPHDGTDRFLFMSYSQEERKTPLVHNEIQNRLRKYVPDQYRRDLLTWIMNQEGCESLSTLQQITRLDFFGYLPDDILVKVDRASMLNSLEVRSPMLDYRIAEFAFSLPDCLRIGSIPVAIRKFLLKRIAKKYLPLDFPFERKQGFCIPESEWFRGMWGNKALNEINDSLLISKSNIRRILEKHLKTGRCGRSLFQAVMLDKWLKVYK